MCEKAENPIKGRIYIDETSDTDRVEHYMDFIDAEHDYSYDEDPANKTTVSNVENEATTLFKILQHPTDKDYEIAINTYEDLLIFQPKPYHQS